MKEIKHLFMTYRNGVVADMLRRGGMSCYKVIFGLNLPQLKEIAAQVAEGEETMEMSLLADRLWADVDVRESRLLAIHLFGMINMDRSKVQRIISEIKSREEAEVLCLRLLRNLPYAAELSVAFSPANPLQEHLIAVFRRHLA